MRVEFNPQQRLVKEIIDEIYRARGSIFVMTDDLYNDFVVDALAYKIQAGFDVRVVLSPNAVVAPQRVDEINALFASHDKAELRIAQGYDQVPTVVITDVAPDRNGDRWARTGMVLSHGFFYQAPFEILTPSQVPELFTDSDVIRIYPSDLFADGTLLTWREFSGQQDAYGELADLEEFWASAWDVSTAGTVAASPTE